jgi:hypothetical protein
MPKSEETTKFLEVNSSVLFRAIRAIFKREVVDGFYLTDLLRLEPRERGDIGRGDWVIRMARNYHENVMPKPKADYAFLYIDAEEAATVLKALEAVSPLGSPEEIAIFGPDGIGTRLKEEFPQL